MSPLLSIVIASKDQDEFIPALIVGLKKQTFQNFEVIVVDSSTKNLSSELFKGYEKVRLLREDMTADLAWRHGFSLASGKYVMLGTTSDYLYSDTWLATAISALERSKNISLVWSSAVGINEVGEVTNLWGDDFIRFPPPNGCAYLSYWFANYYIPELNYVVHRNVFMDCINENSIEVNSLDLDMIYKFLFTFTSKGYLQMYLKGIAHAGRVHEVALTRVNKKINNKYSDNLKNAQFRCFIKILIHPKKFVFRSPDGNIISRLKNSDRFVLPINIIKYVIFNKIIYLLKRTSNLLYKIAYHQF